MFFRPLLFVVAGVITAHAGSAQHATEPASLDLILAGGTVHDGTGAAGRRLDVGIAGGRITALGDLTGVVATRRIDVTGLCIAPGFIDTHAHADASVLRRPAAANFLAMGVTTIVTGNCGNSMRDLGRHFKSLDKRRPAVNYASLIGHNTVRRAAMGTANRRPTKAELETMEKLVDKAMRDGAMGLSTGLIYVPGTYSETSELIALAKVAGRYSGLYVSHMRNENDHVLKSIDEALRIGREAGVHVHLSHLKASGRKNWGRGKDIVAKLEKARADGARITGDQYAYAASSTGIDVLFPTDALGVGRKAFARKLEEDEGFRAKMHAALITKMDKVAFGDFAWCQVSYAKNNPDVSGKNLKQVAKIFFGRDDRDSQADAAIKLFADTRGDARVNMVFHSMSEEDVVTIMQKSFVGVACDAGIRASKGVSKPHPRGNGNNARVLAYFVREKGVLSLPLAIHKMTELPAKVFGLQKRGLVRKSYHADLTVFDAKKVSDRATYEDPRRSPTGIPWVLVNGRIVIEKGVLTGTRPGRVLRHAKKAAKVK